MMLGNLRVEEIEKRLGVEFDNETRKWLNEHRQENVSVALKKETWHCFDLPFTMMCDSEETAEKIYNLLLPYSKNCICKLGIAW